VSKLMVASSLSGMYAFPPFPPATLILRIVSMFVAVFGRKADDEAELGDRPRARSWRSRRPCSLYDCVDVAGIETEASCFLAIHLNIQIRLP